MRYLASLDIKDGYHHFAIHESFRKFFQFCVNGTYYEALTLPFGWNQSPHFFVALANIFFNWLKNPLAVAPDFPLSHVLKTFRY